jgi:hypothetical protein
MRAGVTNRIHGWVIAGLEAAVFLVPFAVAQFLPLYFYGSLLAVFGVEIAGDCEFPTSRRELCPGHAAAWELSAHCPAHAMGCCGLRAERAAACCRTVFLPPGPAD